MIRRLLLCCLILPLAALAQIQVFLFDGTNETPVGALVDIGSASPGDTLATRFHVRNVGARSRRIPNVVDRWLRLYDFPDARATLHDRPRFVCGVSRRFQPYLHRHLQRVSAGECDKYHSARERDAVCRTRRWGR